MPENTIDQSLPRVILTLCESMGVTKPGFAELPSARPLCTLVCDLRSLLTLCASNLMRMAGKTHVQAHKLAMSDSCQP